MRLEPCGWVQPKAKRCGKVALLCKALFFIGIHLPYTMAASRFYRYFLRNFPHLANVTDVCVCVRSRVCGFARACVVRAAGMDERRLISRTKDGRSVFDT